MENTQNESPVEESIGQFIENGFIDPLAAKNIINLDPEDRAVIVARLTAREDKGSDGRSIRSDIIAETLSRESVDPAVLLRILCVKPGVISLRHGSGVQTNY